MKRFLLILLALSWAAGLHAEGDWRTTLGRVKDLSGDTGTPMITAASPITIAPRPIWTSAKP